MCDETPRLAEARRGFSIRYRGKNLLSLYDPITQAEKLADAAEKMERTLFLCPSPLLGYGLQRLLDTMGDDSALLCVESDEKLMALSREAIGQAILDHPRFRLTHIRGAAQLCAFVKDTWGQRSFRRVTELKLNGGWQLDPDLYASLADALRREITLDWSNAITLMTLGRRYARNTVRNLALLPAARRLGELNYGSQPLLVLGAGPSLDPLLERLIGTYPSARDPRTRPFRIICVDTALPALRARDIKPDLAVALEAQHWNLRDFIGLKGWNIPLLMDLSALPASAGALGGELYLFMTCWTSLSLFDRLEQAGLIHDRVPPLGSVGISAAEIALRLSGGPVLIGGIDFSFTLDAFHARSSPSSLSGLARQNRLTGLIRPETAFSKGSLKIQSKSGDGVRSTHGMLSYRNIFEQEFSGESRLKDTLSSGLPLGIPALGPEEAFSILLDATPPETERAESGSIDSPAPPDKERLRESCAAFIRSEQETLRELRRMLTGEGKARQDSLDTLLDRADYLWAHFPECAGRGGRRPDSGDISF
ncbi:DUF115 domain-containing protein, partial [Treponema sp. OttesenSCG-928-L16]|nr:DUF115 domain-containing protein [Treponema sp. OttesenSCG-928-L16]